MSVVAVDVLCQARNGVIDRLEVDPLAPGLRIAIYGAGFLGTWAVGWLRQNGVEPVACFDGNAEKRGTELLGVPVHAPEEIERLKPDLVLITARHAVRAVAAVLEAHRVRGCSLDAYFAATRFGEFLDVHDNLLDDRRSKESLRGVLLAMLTGDRGPLADICEKDQYFCLPRFAGSTTESYVDAGAYVGDSVERFIWANAGVFGKIYAFEPGVRQFAALEKRTHRLIAEWALEADAITVRQVGLSDGPARMSAASASGQLQSASLSESQHGSIPVASLDAMLGGEKVTFIKADVEGMELSLLKGAAGTITRFRPKLAICVYHYPSDIPVISAYIQSLVPEYRFALRHHSPQLMETVLYCWVE